MPCGRHGRAECPAGLSPSAGTTRSRAPAQLVRIRIMSKTVRSDAPGRLDRSCFQYQHARAGQRQRPETLHVPICGGTGHGAGLAHWGDRNAVREGDAAERDRREQGGNCHPRPQRGSGPNFNTVEVAGGKPRATRARIVAAWRSRSSAVRNRASQTQALPACSALIRCHVASSSNLSIVLSVLSGIAKASLLITEPRSEDFLVPQLFRAFECAAITPCHLAVRGHQFDAPCARVAIGRRRKASGSQKSRTKQPQSSRRILGCRRHDG
jgi:hypothetical protein